MNYRLSFARATQQIIDISITLEIPAEGCQLQLPYWRPGRYTRQEYARTISDFRVKSELGEPLFWKKIDARTWEIIPREACRATVSYGHYAVMKDAGGTYVDHSRILFNGITCLLYAPNNTDQPCSLQIDLPEGYEVGGGLPGEGPAFSFEDYHHLVDTPFLAGPDLEHHEAMIGGMATHLWLLGSHSLNTDRLLREISAYAPAQKNLFGDCPVEEYHYLYLFWPHRFRHGVEHHNSTVIVMGPGHTMHQPAAHKSLLEISSHEFFHTWNVKALRPEEMYRYNYNEENYSRLHYVTEGVTTYYGDLMLWKSGIWSWDQWVDSINGELARHYGMAGKDFVSLSQASFDSWVNGYDTSGFPNRRISFYTKGYLVALLTDHQIRQFSKGAHSLDDVLHDMYQHIAKSNRGYSAEDYQETVEKYAGRGLNEFFAKYIHGIQPLEPELMDLAAVSGMRLVHVPPASPMLARTGIVWKAERNRILIDEIWPDSPAAAAPVYHGDIIVAINGVKPGPQPDELLANLESGSPLRLSVIHNGELNDVHLNTSLTTIGAIPQLISMIDANPDQVAWRAAWQQLGGAVRAASQPQPSGR